MQIGLRPPTGASNSDVMAMGEGVNVDVGDTPLFDPDDAWSPVRARSSTATCFCTAAKLRSGSGPSPSPDGIEITDARSIPAEAVAGQPVLQELTGAMGTAASRFSARSSMSVPTSLRDDER